MNEMNDELSMEEVLGTGKTLTPDEQAERERQQAERNRLLNEKVMFRGVERKRRDFNYFDCQDLSNLGDNPEISWSGFTEEEHRRAAELAKPFNDRFYDENDDNSMSMFAESMDKNGFIFAVRDNLTDSILEIVPEKDLNPTTKKA
jgi:hypothetical protein